MNHDKKFDAEEESQSQNTKKGRRRWRGKLGQNHSQWDLIDHDHIEEALEEDERDKIEIVNVQLQLSIPDENQVEEEEEDGQDLIEQKPKESFLKRSGSLLRRSISMRRKKKLKTSPANNPEPEVEKDENFADIVQQINETLNEVAALGDGGEGGIRSRSENAESDDKNLVVCHLQVQVEPELSLHSEPEREVKRRKESLKVGLRRQASKLTSKFRKTPGSQRLRSTASFDSLHDRNRRPRSASFSGSNPRLDRSDENCQRSALRRTMSFKRAKKFMAKGVSSFGKNMMHASAVMPIAYESPPASFYPDFENSEECNYYPQELANCYYRTLSYQPKENGGRDQYQMGDRVGGLHGHQTLQRRPTGFYQHGYCYNG